MSLLSFADVAVRAIDTVWSLADDFAPSQTLRELASLLQEIRESVLDGQAVDQEALLEGRIAAVRLAHQNLTAELAAAGPGGASTLALENRDRLERRLSLLTSLLEGPLSDRDALGGTLAVDAGPPSASFKPLAEQPTTMGFVSQHVRALAERRLGTTEKQDATLTRRVRLEERLRLLSEIDHGLAAAASATSADGAAVAAATNRALSVERDATAFAQQVLRPKSVASRAPSGTTAPPPSANSAPPGIHGARLKSGGTGKQRINIGH